MGCVQSFSRMRGLRGRDAFSSEAEGRSQLAAYQRRTPPNRIVGDDRTVWRGSPTRTVWFLTGISRSPVTLKDMPFALVASVFSTPAVSDHCRARRDQHRRQEAWRWTTATHSCAHPQDPSIQHRGSSANAIFLAEPMARWRLPTPVVRPSSRARDSRCISSRRRTATTRRRFWASCPSSVRGQTKTRDCQQFLGARVGDRGKSARPLLKRPMVGMARLPAPRVIVLVLPMNPPRPEQRPRRPSLTNASPSAFGHRDGLDERAPFPAGSHSMSQGAPKHSTPALIGPGAGVACR